MKKLNTELKKILARVKSTQSELQRLLKDKTLLKEVKKYPRQAANDLRRRLKADIERARSFFELARGELESVLKQYGDKNPSLKKTIGKLRKVVSKSRQKAKPKRARSRKVSS